jgi:hypothetical protein
LSDARLRQVPDCQRVTLGRTVDRHGVITEDNSIEYWAGDPDLLNERYLVMLDRRSEELAEVYSVKRNEGGGFELCVLDDDACADVLAWLPASKF